MREVKMEPIRSIDRAIDVLQSFSLQSPVLSVEEVSVITSIPKSTVYRILCTLETRGLVQFDESTAKYKLGLRLLELGFVVSAGIDIKTKSEEILSDLQVKTNQTVLMAIREGDEIIYIYTKEKYTGLKFSSYVGQRRPFLYGVLGPLLLSYIPVEEQKRILKKTEEPYASLSESEQESTLKRLDQIKKDGYYTESNETTIGVTGVGAPVFDVNGEVAAAIGVIGSAVEVDAELEKIKKLTLEASYRISHRLGYTNTF